MELIAEVEPTRSREKLEAWIPPLRGLVDWVDIPESPLGVARAHSIAVAHFIEDRYGLPGIAHLRTQDTNEVGLRSLVGAAVLLGLRRLVLLRGDPPRGAAPCGGPGPEEGVAVAREHGLGRLEVGLLLSARKSPAEIRGRLSRRPDFALVLNATPQRLELVGGIARKWGVRLYAYMIVETKSNRWITGRLPPYTPRYTAEEAPEAAEL
nr:methylenetetrahydrofolate reductase [Desulfurococcales archaeon]